MSTAIIIIVALSTVIFLGVLIAVVMRFLQKNRSSLAPDPLPTSEISTKDYYWPQTEEDRIAENPYPPGWQTDPAYN
jgi:hypothetical protein